MCRPLCARLVVTVTLALVACTGGASAPSQPAASTAPTAGAAAASASAAPTAAPTAPAELTTIQIATTPSISNGGRYIAEERGYFAEEGIQLEDVSSDTSAKMLPSLAAGQIEIGAGGVAAGLFNAIAQGIPVRIVLDQWTAYPGNGAGGIIVRKDLIDSGRVRDFADLRGLNIAITSKGQATQYGLAMGLAKGGLTLADVETTELSYPDMTLALGNKAVDAAVTIEPYAATAVAQGFAARFKAWPELIPNDNPAMQMYSEAFADGRNDVARRYAKAYVRGLRAYNDARTKGIDRDEVIAILIKNTPLKDRAIYDQMPWPSNSPDGRVNPETIAAAQDWFAENGYVPTKVDLTKVIDNQFADYAVQQLGPYQP
ncbi:MAG TPA: ABC transporter substrate-binding protein [Chloroflexota bacterium]|nr:ABC transporter substrate-binding protein [Chloroflexota bacterium]